MLREPISIIFCCLEWENGLLIDILLLWSFPRQHCWVWSRFPKNGEICLCDLRASWWTSRPQIIFIFGFLERRVRGAFLWLPTSGGEYREPLHRSKDWWGHGPKTRFWISRVLVRFLASWLVDLPTSDDFYFWTIRKMSVRRVFMAIKRRWGVPPHPSTNHELKRAWCDQNSFKMTQHVESS